MGIDKRGGFLQMFDWNSKSRKKLFPSKQDLPELSKQKKSCEGNLNGAQCQMRDENEVAGTSTVKRSGDHSSASSDIDEDGYGNRAPGVVARLMGLDCLPKSSVPEPHSTPIFDSQALRDSYYRTRSLEYCQQDQMLLRNEIDKRYQRVINRPMEKFQTEMLPPKSAKSIPVTSHKLLSPIKSASFIPPEDAAHIMEAAARIIKPVSQDSTKAKLPLVGSSLAPLRVKDLKERVDMSPKTRKPFEVPHRRIETSDFEKLTELSLNKSGRGSLYGTSLKILQDDRESTTSVKGFERSISPVTRAKASAQKKDNVSLSSSSSSLVSSKDGYEFNHNQLFSGSTSKKPYNRRGSGVLRQNNQKQNRIVVSRGKSPSKCNQKEQNSGRLIVTSKAGSRKQGTDFKDDKRDESNSSSKRVNHRKRSIDGSYRMERNQNSQDMVIEKSGKAVMSNSIMGDHRNWGQDIGMAGSDVVSFTFNTPMKRSTHASSKSVEDRARSGLFKACPQSKKSFLRSDIIFNAKYPSLVQGVKGADALSDLLEQKLKELSHNVEFSKMSSGEALDCSQPDLNITVSSSLHQRAMDLDNQVLNGCTQTRKFLDFRVPSPISVLEHSSFVETCNSETADSSSTGSKQFSSIQTQDLLDAHSKASSPTAGDADLSDSASSTSITNVVKRKKEATVLRTENSMTWEQEYVKEMLCNIELAYQDYAMGRARDIVSPDVFNRLESRKWNLETSGITPRILFDCVNESLELRLKHFVSGGCQSWAKGLYTIRGKDRLAGEIYNEISGWPQAGEDSMVDELVDMDMSNQHGKWLETDIEAFELGIQIEGRILNSLIDEVIADRLVH